MLIPKGRLVPNYRLKDTEEEVSSQLPVERYRGGVQIPAMPDNYRLKDTEDFALFGIGVESLNDVLDIENPSSIHNTGTDSRGKRLKSKKEMLEKESLKPKRKRGSCKQMASHDKQNCPLKTCISSFNF
uniref:Uncharacterized protein n=1 Tax=Lactuca sativa TaxID=4236 RepID=A0A9R1UFJ3_LACSA|nr:hypothetical protein LSAT_V11C900499730 [Lactuca sativa]